MKEFEKIEHKFQFMELLLIIIIPGLYKSNILDGVLSVMVLITLLSVILLTAMREMFQAIHFSVAMSSLINTVSTKEIMDGKLDKLSDEEMYTEILTKITSIQEEYSSKN